MKKTTLLTLIASLTFASSAFAITGSTVLSATDGTNTFTANYSASKSVTVNASANNTAYVITAGHLSGANKAKGMQYATTESLAAVVSACASSTHPAAVTAVGTNATGTLPSPGTCATGAIGTASWQ